jgi:hypothetical protein
MRRLLNWLGVIGFLQAPDRAKRGCGEWFVVASTYFVVERAAPRRVAATLPIAQCLE